MSSSYLRIHHLDTGKSGGDATFIAFWEAGATQPSKLCLIDGGGIGDKATIDRAWNTYGFGTKKLDYIISTNYNSNYAEGLPSVFWDSDYFDSNTVTTTTNTRIVDRGQQGEVYGDAKAKGDKDPAPLFSNYPFETVPYFQYRRNIQEVFWTKDKGRTEKWLTRNIATKQGKNATNWKFPFTYLDGSQLISLGDEVKIQILAMGAYINGGGGRATPKTDEVDELSYSLALLVSYNDFRYYHGGVLATCGEGGTPYIKDIPTPENNNSVLSLFEKWFTLKDIGTPWVHAAKLSNQGAFTGSAKDFLSKICPSAAIITCGTDRMNAEPTLKQPSFPSQKVLDAIPESTRCYLNGESLDIGYKIDPGKHVVAGAWAPGSSSPLCHADITLEVSSDDSQGTSHNPKAFSVKYEAAQNAFSSGSGSFHYAHPVTVRDAYRYSS